MMWDRSDWEYRISRIVLLSVLIYPLIFFSSAYFTSLYAGGNSFPFFSDYGAYYHAAIRFLRGYPLYEPSSSIPALSNLIYNNKLYLYPPIFVIIFLPFTVLPFVIGALIWNMISLTILIASVFVFLKEIGGELSNIQMITFPWFIIGFAPTMWWLGEGQIAGLLTAAVCFIATIIHQSKNSERTGQSVGVVTSLVVLIKPFYLPLQLVLFQQRRRLVIAFMAVLLFITLNLMFGFSTLYQYITLLATAPGRDFLYVSPLQWTSVIFRPFAVFGPLESIVQFTFLLSFVVFILWKSIVQSEHYDGFRVLSLSLLAIVLAPGATAGTLTVLLPVFVYLLVRSEQNDRMYSTWVFISLFLIQIHPLSIRFLSQFVPKFFPSFSNFYAPFIPLLQPALYGVFILVVIILSYPDYKTDERKCRSVNGP